MGKNGFKVSDYARMAGKAHFAVTFMVSSGNFLFRIFSAERPLVALLACVVCAAAGWFLFEAAASDFAGLSRKANGETD